MRWLLLSLLCLTACDADKVARLEKENKELKAKLDERSKLVDLDTQSKCSTAAKIFFHQNWREDKDTILLDYSNHYNSKVGKCFIIVEWHYNDTVSKRGEWYGNIQLHDVFENNKYAELSEHTDVDYQTFKSTKRVLRCNVDGEECKSSEEFAAKTRGYITE